MKRMNAAAPRCWASAVVIGLGACIGPAGSGVLHGQSEASAPVPERPDGPPSIVPAVPPPPPLEAAPGSGPAASAVSGAATQAVSPGAAMDAYFIEAQKAFAAGQFAVAGGRLFEGAALLESMGDPARQPHAEAVATLRLLAYDTASQEVADPTRYDRAYAAAHHVLAEDFFLTAKGAWAERRTTTAGRSLQSSAYHLHRAVQWGGREPNPEGQTVLRVASETGAALAADDSFPPAQVGEALDKLGRMIPEVGLKLAEDRGGQDLDDRVRRAADKAVEGIKKGTRKVGEKLRDFGRSLQSIE